MTAKSISLPHPQDNFRTWACETYPQGAEDCIQRLSRQPASMAVFQSFLDYVLHVFFPTLMGSCQFYWVFVFTLIVLLGGTSLVGHRKIVASSGLASCLICCVAHLYGAARQTELKVEEPRQQFVTQCHCCRINLMSRGASQQDTSIIDKTTQNCYFKFYLGMLHQL